MSNIVKFPEIKITEKSIDKISKEDIIKLINELPDGEINDLFISITVDDNVNTVTRFTNFFRGIGILEAIKDIMFDEARNEVDRLIK